MTLKQKQALLSYLGYYSGAIDGIWGEQSKGATVGFQLHYMEQEDVDGDFGPKTEARILEVIATGEEPVDKKSDGTDCTSDCTNVQSNNTDDRTHNNTETPWCRIKYFKKSEFACKCGKYCDGYPAEIDMDMVKIADGIRARIGKPISINSGLRCKTHNANVGGVSNSQHLLGKAADLGCPPGCTPAQMASIADEIMGDAGGIGTYSWGIHIDTRSTKSRWNG